MMKTNSHHRIKHTKVLELTADSSGVNCDWQIGSYTDSYSIHNVRVGSRGNMEFKVESTREQLGREIRVRSRRQIEFKVYNQGIEIRVGSRGYIEFKVYNWGIEIRVGSRGYMEFKVYNWGIEITVGSTGRESLKQ